MTRDPYPLTDEDDVIAVRLRETSAAYDAVGERLDEIREDLWDLIRQARGRGMSAIEIAEITGLTRQRVTEIVREGQRR